VSDRAYFMRKAGEGPEAANHHVIAVPDVEGMSGGGLLAIINFIIQYGPAIAAIGPKAAELVRMIIAAFTPPAPTPQPVPVPPSPTPTPTPGPIPGF